MKYTASGKLLLFGEYFVLKGSPCFAVPLKFGQNLEIRYSDDPGVFWEVNDPYGQWIKVQFDEELNVLEATDKKQASQIRKVLRIIQKSKPDIVWNGLSFHFSIDFDRSFGFGTSSTFLSLLAQWSGVNAYDLLAHTFRGSGYDIAAAQEKKAFTYTVDDRLINRFEIHENIQQQVLFVYLGNKQKSSSEVQRFSSLTVSQEQMGIMHKIVGEATECKEIEVWEALMEKSEDLLSSVLKTEKVKEKLFADYPYAIKSLGAWGGDFVMATCRDIEEAKAYFQKKNKQPVFLYKELIK